MTAILWAVGIVAGLGLLAGLILAVASVLMAVPVDEKVQAMWLFTSRAIRWH